MAASDDLYKLLCCFDTQARALLDADPILRAPAGGGVGVGPEFCCDALYVWVGDSTTPILSSASARNPGRTDECTSPLTRNFTVALAMPACSEQDLTETGCNNNEPFGGCEDRDGTGCPSVDAAISSECSETRTTRQQEVAWMLRARLLLETELGCAVREACVCPSGMATPCLRSVRCTDITPTLVSQRTEGGCHYLDLSYAVTW